MAFVPSSASSQIFCDSSGLLASAPFDGSVLVPLSESDPQAANPAATNATAPAKRTRRTMSFIRSAPLSVAESWVLRAPLRGSANPRFPGKHRGVSQAEKPAIGTQCSVFPEQSRLTVCSDAPPETRASDGQRTQRSPSRAALCQAPGGLREASAAPALGRGFKPVVPVRPSSDRRARAGQGPASNAIFVAIEVVRFAWEQMPWCCSLVGEIRAIEVRSATLAEHLEPNSEPRVQGDGAQDFAGRKS